MQFNHLEMQKKNKIILIVLGALVIGGLAVCSVNAALFQGRFSKDIKPAYDENKCYDSDGGKNYEEVGTVYGKISRSKFGDKIDFCSSEARLTEYYCDGKYVKSEEYLCENGCSSKKCKSNLQINISESNVGESFDLNYSNYLLFPDGVKIYFGYYDFKNNGKKDFVAYSTKSINGKNYLLFINSFSLDFLDFIEIPFACPKLKISIQSADENKYTIKLSKKEDLNDQYCIPGFSDDNKSFDFYIHEEGLFKYYLDKDMFENEDIKDNYLNLLKLSMNESYQFLKNNLKIEPIYLDKIGFIAKLNPSSSPYHAGFNYIVNDWGTISEYDLKLMEEKGSVSSTLTHELVHVFLTSLANVSYFEEGLANYMGALHSNDKSLKCFDDAWETGNSGLVSYSDFSKPVIAGVPYNDPSSASAHYNSAYCFWNFIEQNYPKESIAKIIKSWFDLSIVKDSPPQIKWLIKDVVNPTLGADLSSLVKERYNYIEEY